MNTLNTFCVIFLYTFLKKTPNTGTLGLQQTKKQKQKQQKEINL